MISPDYISEDRLVYFVKMQKTIKLAYNQVTESLSEKVLPDNPNIYPVPFMIAKTYTVHARVVRVLFYSIVYPDKDNFERFANIHSQRDSRTQNGEQKRIHPHGY